MDTLAFVVFGDADRDDFVSAKPYLDALIERVPSVLTVLVSPPAGALTELDFAGWARWARNEGCQAAVMFPQIRLADLPWAGAGTVEDLPVLFLRPAPDGDRSLLGAEIQDFLGDSEPRSGGVPEFALAATPQTVWLRTSGPASLLNRLGFLADFLRHPPAPEPGDSRWELVQLRNEVYEKETRLRRLRDEAQRYRRFFEDDITADFVAGPGGRIVDCNRAFARVFGFPSVDYALGFDLRRLFPSRADRRRLLARFLPRWSVEDQELDLIRPDGRRVSVIANLSGLRDESGRMVQLRGFLYDNTPRKALELQLHEAQKMEGLGRLAGGIAHDFNNLLTVINGYAELLLADLPPDRPEISELTEILQAGLKASELTRQLLAFSKRQNVQPRLVDLGEIVSRMETMIRRLTTERIELSFELDPRPLPFLADRGQIEQVLLNLALNARDAMPEGGTLTVTTRSVTLTTSVYENDELLLPGTYVVLGVADTGVGMDASLRQRVFEPFFTTKSQGTGLGLAMVHGIVKQSGGVLHLTSEPGQGSTFRLYFEQQESQGPPTDEPETKTTRKNARRTLLVVEDDRAVRDYVERILLRDGFRVLAFERATDALERLAHERVDAVLCDVVMPEMTGPDFFQKLQTLGIDIPFLSMSGYTDDEILRHGLSPNAGRFLHKPFQAKNLLDAVHQLLALSEE